MTLSAVLRRMGVAAVPHGFRSTFRDWAAERTDFPREVAEMALAHSIGSKVEAAYRRGDLFDKRKQMMQDWANYAASGAEPERTGDGHIATATPPVVVTSDNDDSSSSRWYEATP